MSMLAPQVTAIVAAYNSGPHIRRALDSLLAQTMTDFEVIVVDDGSTDGTSAVVEEYAQRDGRFRALHQVNLGPPKAANRALAEARGEFIANLDHDDISVPDRFAKQIAYLHAHPRVGVVGGSMVSVDENDRKLLHYRLPAEPSDVRFWLFRQSTINHSSAMMRRELILGIGGYRPCFDVICDVDLFLRASDFAELANLPDVLTYYRVHAGRISTRHHARQLALNEIAISLARGRVRGEPDDISPDFVITPDTLDKLNLSRAEIARIRPMLVGTSMPLTTARQLVSA